MRENTRGYRRKTVNLHVELVSDGDEGYTKKARPTNNRLRHNTRRLVFVIVGIIIVKIFVISCSCHDKAQPMTQSVSTRPT
jgi:hypothetical protein